MNTAPSAHQRLCPRCQSAMDPHEVGLVTLDRCRACAGLWFDRGEFDRAVRIVTGSYKETLRLETMLESVAVRREGGVSLECPSCMGHLIAWDMWEPELEIDTCPRCKGLWLDQGEFEAIHRSVDATRPNLTPEDLQEIQQRPVGSAGVAMVGSAVSGAVEGVIESLVTPRRRGWALIDLLDRLFE